MTAAATRAPRQPPVPSPNPWTGLVGMPGGGWPGNNKCAAYYNGNTYIGYIDGNGAVRVAAYNHATGVVTVSPAIVSGLIVQYHSAPSVLVRSSDHKILVAAAPATFGGGYGSNMYVAVSTNAEDVTSWGAATDISGTLGAANYLYAGLFQLSGESGKIYLFWHTQVTETSLTKRLYGVTSTDGGSTWSGPAEIYETPNKQGYFAVDSDGANRIDFAVTDGVASAGDTDTSVYHFYYDGGSYYKSDGTLITASLPLAPASLTKIYDGTTNGSARNPCTLVSGGGPYIGWPAYNSAGSGSNENYWYAVYSGGAWTVNKITDSGSVPEIPGVIEGDLAIDRTDPTKVFVSKKISGRWQMFLYQTSDGGSTWTSTQLTTDTTDGGDMKPIAPYNAATGLRCVWTSGTYGPAGGPFSFQIRGYPNPYPGI